MAHLREEVRVKKLQLQKKLHSSPKGQLKKEDHLQLRKRLQLVQREEGQRGQRLLLEQEVVQGEKKLLQESKELRRKGLLLADTDVFQSMNERLTDLLHTYQGERLCYNQLLIMYQ